MIPHHTPLSFTTVSSATVDILSIFAFLGFPYANSMTLNFASRQQRHVIMLMFLWCNSFSGSGSQLNCIKLLSHPADIVASTAAADAVAVAATHSAGG